MTGSASLTYRDVMSSTDVKRIGEALREFRLTKKLWTLERMAMFTNLSIPTIDRLEKGKANPSQLTLAKLRRAFPELRI